LAFQTPKKKGIKENDLQLKPILINDYLYGFDYFKTLA